MKLLKDIRISLTLIAAACASISLVSCEDDVPTVGSDLANGEVQIALDSLTWNGLQQYIYRGNDSTLVTCPKIKYVTEYEKAVDSRSTTNLLGRLSVPEYGDLRCSFVSRLMCATSLNIPDSIGINQIDSMKLVLSVPRGELTGDSLAPQQLRVFRLTKSLPADINNTFDPTGYYDPQNPLGSRSYTLSALGMSDSIYSKLSYINVEIPMSREMAVETVEAYRNPETKGIFEWPQSFEKYFHGIYVEPSFGRGCVANISDVNFLIYYSYKNTVVNTTDSTTTTEVQTKVGATGIFETSPIVLNSNNISYTPSASIQSRANAGEAIITAPGGYRVRMSFPAKELIDIYRSSQSKLAVVSGLSFSIPAEEISNDYGLTPPPYLLLIKTSKIDDFFANNSLPDNKDSFYATYSSTTKKYTFSSMRQYILDIIEKGVTEDDTDFTIIPVNLTLESNASNNSSSYYDYYYYYYGYSSSNSNTTYTVTKCTPYIAKPAMCRLKLDEASTVFTYSIQQMQ
ncbi:MAG: DUF4270 domain-containing protein [Muribaculum sp.]|nr:DUF4270 domain-containing protein [Muribaculum sp.]